MAKKIIPQDPKFLKQRVELAESLKQAILAVVELHKNYYYREHCFTFIRCIVPPNEPDVSVLPVVSANGTTKRKNRIYCLLALISSIITLYWEFYEGNLEAFAPILTGIELLNSFSEVAYKDLVIVGDISTGYHVEVKK